METILKEVIGVDVASNELVASFGRLKSDLSVEIFAYKVFKNTENGFCAFLLWAKSQSSGSTPFRVVMEATGVYHQKFAYFLEEKGYEVSIVLPNKISNYQRTLDVKTITDKSMSECIARFGLGRKLTVWKRPKAVFRNMQQLTRERNQIVDERSAVKNQKHAEQIEAYPNENTLKRLKARIVFLNQQEVEIKKEIDALIVSDEELKGKVENVCTITGVGKLTVATILGETNGFDLILNKRQLSSYAGYDVVEKTSGTSIKGKPKMSKKGNVHIRKAMHLPALSAIRYDENFKGFYARLVQKSGVKMKGVVAVSRKLLELIYILFTKNEKYDKSFEKKKAEANLATAS
jgi:transposase